jgi:hypothetical protein
VSDDSSSGFYVYEPSGDSSGATDASTINSVLASGQPLRTVPGLYYTDATLQIPANAVWHGFGTDNDTAGSVVQQVPNSNLNAIAASAGWTSSTNTGSVAPCDLRGIAFVGQPAQTAGLGHGIVLQTYRSRLLDIQVNSVFGDGIRLDYYGANGSTALAGTAVENRIERCAVRGAGGRGFGSTDPTGDSVFTDGFFINNIIADGVGLDGLYLGAGAGWRVVGNHLYGKLPLNGINVQRPYMTEVSGNYIDNPWGQTSTAGTYSGIFMNAANDAGNGSIVSGNRVRLISNPGNASSTICGIRCTSGNGDQGNFAVVGNIVRVASGVTPATSAFQYVNGNSSSSLNVTSTGNNIIGGWTNTIQQVANGGTITLGAGS